jgi:hypothetical protein
VHTFHLCNSKYKKYFTYLREGGVEVFTIPHEFRQIPSRMSKSAGIQLAGASAIPVSNSMEIPMESGSLPEQFPLESIGTPTRFQRNAVTIAVIIIFF